MPVVALLDRLGWAVKLTQAAEHAGVVPHHEAQPFWRFVKADRPTGTYLLAGAATDAIL